MASTWEQTLAKNRPQDWINLILGICLFVAPWAFSFTQVSSAAWNAWAVGVAVVALTVAAMAAFAEWEEWLAGALGVWLIVSPWVIQFATTSAALWTHVVIGVLILAAAAWAIWETREQPQAHA